MSEILVTGGSGLVGHSLKKFLPDATYLCSSDYDLRKQDQVESMYERHRPKCVVHLAGTVGGVKSNTTRMAEFFYDNITINTNVLHYAAVFGVDKVVSLMSTCIFPDRVDHYPITEDFLHQGNPHYSNFGYAYAKRMLDIQSRAYRQQYGSNFVTIIPNNLYGPFDNFDLHHSHVIPAVIHKIFRAKQTGEPAVFWGNGEPLRQFTYVDDLAQIIKRYIIPYYNAPSPLNVGDEREVSISYIVKQVCKLFEFKYKGNVIWQPTEHSGQYRKTASYKKMDELGYNHFFTHIESGLKRTVDWWNERVKSKSVIRGLGTRYYESS